MGPGWLGFTNNCAENAIFPNLLSDVNHVKLVTLVVIAWYYESTLIADKMGILHARPGTSGKQQQKKNSPNLKPPF